MSDRKATRLCNSGLVQSRDFQYCSLARKSQLTVEVLNEGLFSRHRTHEKPIGMDLIYLNGETMTFSKDEPPFNMTFLQSECAGQFDF